VRDSDTEEIIPVKFQRVFLLLLCIVMQPGPALRKVAPWANKIHGASPSTVQFCNVNNLCVK
jgi:hypothetical protein